MKEEKHICPCCGHDISEYVHQENVLYVRRKNAEKMREAQQNNPELREKLNEDSAKRLKSWRNKNPEEARKLGLKAQACRTSETFARQSDSIKETMRRKSVKFAELLLSAKMDGKELTPELQADLMKKAAELTRAELKAERREAKKKAKESN